MNRTSFTLLGAAALALTVLTAAPVRAAEEGANLKHLDWSFDGVFGRYDRAQLKRGWQVYREVCSACHSVHQLYYRNLVDLGLTEAQAKTIAAADEVATLNDNGEAATRPARLSDKIKKPYPNDLAARAANNGALPPDLSLMTKARKGGADYVFSILTGFHEPPTGFKMQPGMNYNEYFSGHQIAMPPPLSDGQVTFEDGTANNVEQMARDVAAFLNWSAEPELEQRKRLGIKILAFLLVLTALLFAVKRKVWANLH